MCVCVYIHMSIFWPSVSHSLTCEPLGAEGWEMAGAGPASSEAHWSLRFVPSQSGCKRAECSGRGVAALLRLPSMNMCSDFAKFHQNESHGRCEGVTGLSSHFLVPFQHPSAPDRGTVWWGSRQQPQTWPFPPNTEPPHHCFVLQVWLPVAPPPKNHQHRYYANPLIVIKWASQLTNPLKVQWGLNWVWRHRCLTRWREGASQPLISNTCFIHRNRDPAETPREFSLACALDWDQSGSESASLPDRVISDMSSYNTGHPGEGPREELVELFWGKTTALQSGWSPGWENTELEEARRAPWMLCQTRPPGAMTRF